MTSKLFLITGATGLLGGNIVKELIDKGEAEKELGFQCRSLNETIADTISWLKQEGKLKSYSKKIIQPDKA